MAKLLGLGSMIQRLAKSACDEEEFAQEKRVIK